MFHAPHDRTVADLEAGDFRRIGANDAKETRVSLERGDPGRLIDARAQDVEAPRLRRLGGLEVDADERNSSVPLDRQDQEVVDETRTAGEPSR